MVMIGERSHESLTARAVCPTVSSELHRDVVDCKDAYKILFERKSSGRFSKAEDDELIAAVRKACQIPGSFFTSYLSQTTDSIPVSEMPSVNISWLNVAAALNNIRLPLDYQRRWGVLRLTCKDQVEV